MTKQIIYSDDSAQITMTELEPTSADQCGWHVEVHIEGVYDYNDLNLSFTVTGAGEQHAAAKVFRLLAKTLEGK